MAQYECQCEVCRGVACPPEPDYWDCEFCGETNIEEEEVCWKCKREPEE